MPYKEKLLLNADIIINELVNCESYQLGRDSDYSKKMAKINTYNYIVELLGVKGETDAETV